MQDASSGPATAMGESAPAPPYPDWVNWIAQDASGAWWGYSIEPLRNDAGWYENEVGRCIRLGEAEPAGWKRSLRRVSDSGRG
jgi:hypothetical protein